MSSIENSISLLINSTGDSVSVVSDSVSGAILVIININKDSVTVVATATTASSSTIINQSSPFTQSKYVYLMYNANMDNIIQQNLFESP
jgi:hypothetical protein